MWFLVSFPGFLALTFVAWTIVGVNNQFGCFLLGQSTQGLSFLQTKSKSRTPNRRFVWLVRCLAGWLACLLAWLFWLDWLVGCLLAGWLAGWLARLLGCFWLVAWLFGGSFFGAMSFEETPASGCAPGGARGVPRAHLLGQLGASAAGPRQATPQPGHRARARHAGRRTDGFLGP